MDVTAAALQRRSIRKFKPDPVPTETLREILENARWSPSWGNTQSWELFALAGEPLKRFKKANRSSCLDGAATCPEVPMPEVWPRKHKLRYVGVGKQVLSSVGIAREDTAARALYYGEMFDLFGAPCLILTCVDRACLLEYAMLDAGLLNQTICLLAQERGLGTIMLAAAVRYPQLLREVAPISKEHRIVIGTAIGYPDWDSPVNHFERARAPLDELVTWVV